MTAIVQQSSGLSCQYALQQLRYVASSIPAFIPSMQTYCMYYEAGSRVWCGVNEMCNKLEEGEWSSTAYHFLKVSAHVNVLALAVFFPAGSLFLWTAWDLSEKTYVIAQTTLWRGNGERGSLKKLSAEFVYSALSAFLTSVPLGMVLRPEIKASLAFAKAALKIAINSYKMPEYFKKGERLRFASVVMSTWHSLVTVCSAIH